LRRDSVDAPEVVPVPTLGLTGIALLTLLMLGLGVVLVRRVF